MGEELMPCSPEASEPGECEFSPRDLSERFMCFYEQSNVDTVKGSFAECCGFSLSFCNNPSDIGRREGSHIKTLREFVTYAPATTDANVCSKNDSNCVLRYALNKPTPQDVEDNIPYSLGFSSAFNDVDIKDWTSYEYLEFYIYFAANFEQNIKIGRLVGNPEIIEGYSYYFDGPVTDYVVNEPELGKWLHVVIPIDEFIGKPEEVDLILFYADAEELHKAGTTINVGAFPQKDFSNVIGLDKIHLVKEDGENRFCSGTLKPHWLEDLDDSSYVDTPELGYNQAGRAACNAIPSYGWTGNYCCGDDTGRDTEFDPANPGGRKIGDDTFKEFFNDTEAGCWAGQKVADGERMMLVQYILSHEHALGYTDKLFEKSCRSTDGCVYSIPQVPGLVIENPHHETYDLLIGSGTGITRKHVGPGTVLSSNSAQGAVLKSEDVPLQVLFHDKQFRACNGAPYLFEKSNTEVTTDMLILPENNYSSCEIAGDYFCDHVNGSDRGWSAASLTKYPNSTNITLSDGSTVEILTEGSEAPTDRIPPSYRDQIKPTYNLIKNGGFERLR